MTHGAHQSAKTSGSSYRTLAVSVGINIVIMFFVMYAMISSIDHLYLNINNFYMALLMAAPMVLVMLGSMRSMYENRMLNFAIYLSAAAVFVIVFALVRWQSPVGNRQFLRSMIPHHSSAILMCRQANVTDAEIRRLCDGIISSQTREIDQMKHILSRM